MADISTIESTRRAVGSRRVLAVWGLGLALLLPAIAAQASTEVERLLARAEAPEGVVFEIVEADEDALQSLLPRVRDSIVRIRARFPATEIAVVSHGREEFALQSDRREEFSEIHDQVQSLVAADVPVHVCGTHAGWYGVTAEDFPDYVDVAPSGPAQIRLYQELGYELIVVY